MTEGPCIIHWTTIGTPLGEGIVAATGDGVCRVGLPDKPIDEHLEQLGSGCPDAELVEDSNAVQAACGQLGDYWEGRSTAFTAPVDLAGTPFQQSVWRYLQQIPYGQTVTYAKVADAVGSPRAFQAVGRAVGANPVPVIVPCHRVIGSDGSLTGFAAGIDMKHWLLEHEGSLLI